MADRLLLTGATGMIGSLLIDDLIARGVELSVMLRPGTSADRFRDRPEITVVEGDFDDVTSLRRALDGVQRAFLLTNSSERTEAQQTSFVEAAAAAGVGHVVKLSQLAADGDSPVRFLCYHAAVEDALRASGVAWTFVRPNLILQAYLAFASLIASGSLRAPIGDARISVVDARDIAAVAAVALTEDGHAGETYTVTGPAAVSHAEIAAAVGDAIDRTVTFESVPRDGFIAALTGMGMPQWQADGLAEDYGHYDRGEAAFVSDDVRRVTGTPARSLQTFAHDYADAFKRG